MLYKVENTWDNFQNTPYVTSFGLEIEYFKNTFAYFIQKLVLIIRNFFRHITVQFYSFIFSLERD